MLYRKLARSAGSICLMCFLQTNLSYSQVNYPLQRPDTMRISFQQAEKLFLDNNLQLLAQHYNIQSSQALVEQARKWDNPMLITDQNVYANNKFFQHGEDANGNEQGEVFVQVQQLIRTAGKRRKQVDLAKTTVDLADWQFKSVMRSLRATLYKDFYTVAQLQGNAQLYDENMQQLNRLMAAQEIALKGGNIARKEYLRVNALIISLQQDITENAKDLSDAESELKTILAITGNTFVQPAVADSESAAMPAYGIMQLVDTAKSYNTDYQQEVYQLQYNRQNLSLQRSLAVPDFTVAPEYDQNANYAPKYFGLTLSLPLPLWDRNQGNIKSARAQVKQQEATFSEADHKLQNDVLNAYQKLAYTVRLNSNDNSTFYKDYYQLQRNITESYNKRQISLIEFLEYFNDYQDVRKKQLQQTLNLRLAKEELNDVVGKDMIR